MCISKYPFFSIHAHVLQQFRAIYNSTMFLSICSAYCAHKIPIVNLEIMILLMLLKEIFTKIILNTKKCNFITKYFF